MNHKNGEQNHEAQTGKVWDLRLEPQMDFFSSEPAKKSAHKEPAHSGEDQLEIQQNSQSQSQKKTHSQKQNGSQQVRAVSEAQDKEQSEDGEQENSGEAEDSDQQEN